MTSFLPCSSCARHIKKTDRQCPFCHAPGSCKSWAPHPARRMSRARWLALGSTVALVGCNGVVQSSGGSSDAQAATQEGSTGDEGVADEASTSGEAGSDDSSAMADTSTPGVDGSSEASTDGGVVHDAGMTCARSGTFACSTQTCDRASQLCDLMGGGCLAYDAMVPQQYPEAGSCGDCPSCACLQPTLYGDCQCLEDDAGSIAISCGGCYGAPPARLERIA